MSPAQVAVVGLVAEERLDAEQITASGLITIENQVLMWSIPKSVLQTEPGAPAIRSIVTYFAPQADYGLTARFVPTARSTRGCLKPDADGFGKRVGVACQF